MRQKVNYKKLRSAVQLIHALEKASGKRIPLSGYMQILYLFEGISYLTNGKPSIGLTFIKTRTGIFSREVRQVWREIVLKDNRRKVLRLLPLCLLFISCGGYGGDEISSFSYKKNGDRLVFYGEVNSSPPVDISLSYQAEGHKRAEFDPYTCDFLACTVEISCYLNELDKEKYLLTCTYPDGTWHGGEIYKNRTYTFYLTACSGAVCSERSLRIQF